GHRDDRAATFVRARRLIGSGPQRSSPLNLSTNIGGGVEQDPAASVGAHRQRVLRAAPDAALVAGRLAVAANTVPLRDAAASGATQHDDVHLQPSLAVKPRGARPRGARPRAGTGLSPSS